MNLEIAKLTQNDIDDFCCLIRVFEEVFEWDNFVFPVKIHLQKVLASPMFMVFVAKADKQLAGGLTAYVLDSYNAEKPSAYIYDLAVLGSFQRQGIGKSLIITLNNYCKKNGFKEVYVQADIVDNHAVEFYRSTPISSELQAIHFTYSFDNNNH